MFDPTVLPLLCCPSDGAPLNLQNDALTCTQCATVYPIRDGYAELLPRAAYEHTTLYAEAEGAQILDYRDFGRPLLSAQVKNNLLNDFLQFESSDAVLDLGCGNGKFAYWNKDKVQTRSPPTSRRGSPTARGAR